MTTANLITIARIVLIPLFVVILLTEMQNKEIIAFIIFVLAAVTDSIDGYIARKYNEVTDLGKFLDPLADKLLVSAGLISLVSLEKVETWAAALIILREILISAMRFYYLVHNASFSASLPAKIKTTFQLVAISTLIICDRLPGAAILFKIGTWILYVAVFLTIYSGVEYMIKIKRAVDKQDAL